MRTVIARKWHTCSACGEVIEKNEICVQSEGFYGRFFHEECTQAHARVCNTVKELTE